MRPHRPLFVVLLAASLLSVGCAGPASQELQEAQALTMAPGTNASMPLFVADEEFDANVSPEDVTVSAPDDGLEASLVGTVDEDNGSAAWLTVSASNETSEGEHAVEVSVDGEQRTVPVTVETPEDPIERGQVAHLTFSARTQEGELVLTNDENASEAPLPRSASFQEPRSFEPIAPQMTKGGQLPPELVDAVVGSGVGQTQDVEVPELFGPETVEKTQPREQTIQRESTIPTKVDYPPRQAQQILPRDATQGDEVTLNQKGMSVPYTLENMSRQAVSFELALEEGDNFTAYPAWPDAAQVTNLTDSEATVYVTPTDEEGEKLTWIEPWGNVTELASVTDEKFVVRHSPEEGFTYEQPSPRTGQPIQTEVVEVGSDEITVSQTNPHPLAGQTLVFDVTVVDRGKAPSPSQRR